MSSKLASFTGSLALAVLTLGFATPALADVAPSRPAPEEPPPTPTPAPEPPPETKTEPPPEVTQDNGKADKPAATQDEAKADKKGGCSIDDTPERGLLGLAVVVLLISGASLRRRRA